MATTIGTLFDDLFADAVTALKGAGAGKFHEIYDGIVDPEEIEKPFFAMEVLEVESTRVESSDVIKVIKIKLRAGYNIDGNRPGKAALAVIALIEDFLDGYTSPDSSYGFRDRKWSISAQKAQVAGGWGFVDAITEAEANVTRGSN